MENIRVSKTEATNACKEMLTKIGVSNIEINAHSKSLILFGDLDEDTKIFSICSFFNGTITDSIVNVLPIILIRIDNSILGDITFSDIVQMIRTTNIEKGGDDILNLIATIIGIIGASESGRVLDGCIMQTVNKNKETDEDDVQAGVIIYESPENVIECNDIDVLECYYSIITNNELSKLKEVEPEMLIDVVRTANFSRRVVGREITDEIDIDEVVRLCYEFNFGDGYQSIIDTLVERGTIGYDEHGGICINNNKSREEFRNDLEDILNKLLEGNNQEEDDEKC